MTNMFTVELKGLKELQSKFRALDGELQDALSEGVSAGAAVVERDAKILVHVKTGNLRRSIKEIKKIKSSGRVESQVGTDVVYGPPVEFRYPYLRPALDENESEIERAIETKLKMIIGRYK